jgi:transposase-like protein
MPKENSSGKRTTRRYSSQEKADAVRMVRTLRAELGTEHGTRELKRANEILKRAASFFGAELDRQHKK